MEFVHDRNSNIIFSLYGSRVHEMKFHNKMLKTVNLQTSVMLSWHL